MSQQLITSLAILNVNWSQNQDYISNFVPFLAECIRTAPEDVISTEELAKNVYQQFGLHIPLGPMKTILKRVEAQGYIRHDRGVYTRDAQQLNSLNLAATSMAVLRQHETLIKKFTQYCSTEHNLQLSQEDAEDYFLGYLEEHSIPILAAAENGLPTIQPAHEIRRSQYLVYSFVNHLNQTDQDGFNFLVTVVKGRMLTDVLLFPDLGSVQQQFQNVTIFLDTPFLLRALGYTGDSRQAPCLEMLDLLWQEKARLCVFKHNLDELHNVLYACEKSLSSNGQRPRFFSEILEYFLQQGKKAGDIAQLLSSIELSLQRLNIHIVETPPHTLPLGVDEDKFGDYIKREVRYRREEARDTDIASLTAIHRLRSGNLYHKIEDCRAIFVTSNYGLARASFRFFRDEYPGYTVPHCMLDNTLSTLVWLKKPLAAPDLPKKRIIANCYAALNPSDALWTEYLNKIGELQQKKEITPDDYTLLRHSLDARSILMNMTFGDVESFTEGTVTEVLEHAKSVVRHETEQRLNEELAARQRAEEAHQAEALARTQAEQVLRTREQELDTTQERLQQTEHRASQAEQLIQKQRDYAIKCAERSGRIWSRIIGLLLVLTVTLEVLHLLPLTAKYLHRLFEHWAQWIFHGTLIIAALLYLYHAIQGKSIKEIVERLEEAISKRVETRLLRRLGLAEKH